MPRPRRDVPAAEVARLAQVRSAAAAATSQAESVKEKGLLALMPDPATDILGAIAWGVIAVGPTHAAVVELIERALADRREWREIASAFGADPSDDVAVGNIAQAFRRHRAKS